ncbi:MAG TPA: cobalamin B12-binding domain-containing protein [Nocardioides sp.]|nr:cobalamin B12-binding domain-containing protein [Nocardioides sp.]
MSDSSRVQAADLARYWVAVDASDDAAATAGALAARDRGVPLEEVLTGLVVAAQLRVGELWADNRWTVAREHAATAVAESVVRRLADDLPEPTGGPLYVVACVEREWHALPALVVATILKGAGHRTLYLGASASRDELVARILDSGPRLVLLSASLTSSLPRVRRHIEAVRGTGTPTLVGGSAFDTAGLRAHRLGATAYAANVAEAVAMFEAIPRHVPEASPLRHAGALEAREISAQGDEVARDVMTATDHALGLSGGGEAAVSPDDWRVVLATYVPHVVDSLVGALLTDDPSVIAQTRSWLEDVLTRRGGDPGAFDALQAALSRRLREYPQALRLLGA